MSVQIDQSGGKIERTEKDTVLAFSNGDQRAIVITARVKRKTLRWLHSRGVSRKMAVLHLFSVGLFLLLEPSLPSIVRRGEQIMIDTEYTNQDSKIKGMLLRHCHNNHYALSKNQLFFGQIGRSSPAHKVAYAVHQKKRKADHYVSLTELIEKL